MPACRYVLTSAIETSRPLIEESRHELAARSRPAGLSRRRRDPAGPGLFESVEQRGQVHAPRRPNLAGRRRKPDRSWFASATPASASPPIRCRASSKCSPSSTIRCGRMQGGLGIGLTLSSGWSRCTAERSKPTAPAGDKGANLSCVCRSIPSCNRTGRRPSRRTAPMPARHRSGGFWWSTTTSTRPRP